MWTIQNVTSLENDRLFCAGNLFYHDNYYQNDIEVVFVPISFQKPLINL